MLATARSWIARFGTLMTPGPAAWRGAAYGIVAGSLGCLGLMLESRVFDAWSARWALLVRVPFGVGTGLAAALGAFVVLRLFRGVPAWFCAVLVGCLTLLYFKA